jgi:hypothetical protein
MGRRVGHWPPESSRRPVRPSRLAAFEAFVTHALYDVQNNPKLWGTTATLVAFDEGRYVPIKVPAVGDLFDLGRAADGGSPRFHGRRRHSARVAEVTNAMH